MMLTNCCSPKSNPNGKEATPAHSHDAVRLALRPEVGGRRGGGRLRGLGRALRRPHSGLVEPLSQVLLILPHVLLQTTRPGGPVRSEEVEGGVVAVTEEERGTRSRSRRRRRRREGDDR